MSGLGSISSELARRYEGNYGFRAFQFTVVFTNVFMIIYHSLLVSPSATGEIAPRILAETVTETVPLLVAKSYESNPTIPG